MHRRLRGRYAWAFLLTLLGIAAGVLLGWTSTTPLYRATGSIYIKPIAADPGGGTGQRLLPLFDSFLASQVQVLSMGKITTLALDTHVWRDAGGTSDPEAARAFMARRTVTRVPGTHVVQVTFVDPDPKVAEAGVRALLEVYEDSFVELNDVDEGDRVTAEQMQRLVQRLKQGMDRLESVTAGLGGVEGVEIRYRAAVQLVLLTEDALRSLRTATSSFVGGRATASMLRRFAPSEIAVESEQMAEYLSYLALQEAEEKILRARRETTARTIELRQRISVLREGIAEFAENWNRERAARIPDGPTLEDLRAREQGLVQRLETLEKKSQALGRVWTEARTLKTANEELSRQLARIEEQNQDLGARLAGKGHLQVVDAGTRPTAPFEDFRAAHAAVAGAIGGLLGFLFVLLTGSVDRRLKDAGHVEDVLTRVRSLGLLPSLPTDPGDGEGGRTASHFTHQIRTLLEIAHARAEGACICVSGPAPGSGTTTLTAALGLSFASTGSRTLLVDADRNGRGLTRAVIRTLARRARRAGRGDLAEAQAHPLAPLVPDPGEASSTAAETVRALLGGAVERMGLRRARETGVVDDLFSLADLLDTDEARSELALGLMDALASEGELSSGSPAAWIPARTRELGVPGAEFDDAPFEHHVYRTGVDALLFLPLFDTWRERGSSVATIVGILTRLKSQFDVVLVDAGPVPGADETSLIALGADSVVLVVSPEDQGPDAERAIAHLEEIGARVAGVVFNRATPRDIVKTGRTPYAPQRGAG